MSSVVFGDGLRQVVTIVIATCLLDRSTEVFVIDPPDEPGDKHPDEDSSEKISERTGKGSWRSATYGDAERTTRNQENGCREFPWN